MAERYAVDPNETARKRSLRPAASVARLSAGKVVPAAPTTPGNERPGSAGSKGGGSRPGSASKTMRPGTPQKDDNVFVATEPRRRSLRAAGSAAKLGAGLASSKIVNIAAVEGEELPPPPFVDTPPPEEKKKKRTVVTGIPRLMPEDSGLEWLEGTAGLFLRQHTGLIPLTGCEPPNRFMLAPLTNGARLPKLNELTASFAYPVGKAMESVPALHAREEGDCLDRTCCVLTRGFPRGRRGRQPLLFRRPAVALRAVRLLANPLLARAEPQPPRPEGRARLARHRAGRAVQVVLDAPLRCRRPHRHADLHDPRVRLRLAEWLQLLRALVLQRVVRGRRLRARRHLRQLVGVGVARLQLRRRHRPLDGRHPLPRRFGRVAARGLARRHAAHRVHRDGDEAAH